MKGKKISLLLGLSMLFIQHTFASPLEPTRLMSNYIINPLGIHDPRPVLSWNFKSTAHNQMQQAFEIILSDNRKDVDQNRGKQWVTGKINRSTSEITYSGSALQPFTRYYWRVKVYNQDNSASSWSDIAWFETAMMQSTDWTASWITDPPPYPDPVSRFREDPMPLFRKSFVIKKNIAKARLYISGLGYYETFLNGSKTGDAVLDPGWTAYSKEVLFSIYDITQQLKKGINIAGIHLGSGWWDPLPLRLFGRWDLRDYQQTGRPCVKAEIHISYNDGSKEIIKTDQSWQTKKGPVIRNSVYLGEHYDARLEQTDWLTSYPVLETWNAAIIVNGPSGKLIPQLQPPIRITKIIKPVSIRNAGKDTFIVDMGQNFAGVARIHVKGKRGTKITLRLGEDIFSDGRINLLTTATTQIKKAGARGGSGAPETAWQEDSYTLKGSNKIESWSPRFTFHGFRFVEITGWPGTPTLNDIEGLRMNTDLETVGEFSCSNEMFNQLHAVNQWTFLSNVFSVQSDCPGREKMGYGADMVVSANAFIYNYDMHQFYCKAVRDFANDQRDNGGITEIAPSTGINDLGPTDSTGPLGWQLAFPYLQWQLYEMYGNKQILTQYYPSLQKQIDFLRAHATDHLYLKDISDHEAIDPKPEAFTASAFYYHHVKLAAKIAGVLDKKTDSTSYQKLADTISNKIRERFEWKGTGRFDNGTQAAQLFALYYDLSPDPAKSFDTLVKEIRRNNGHLTTGIFSTQMLFEVMRKLGRNDMAYEIANQCDYPGWGYMLSRGATTLWETWGFSETVHSRNHPMFGSIDEWFYRSILGINPLEPGFSKIQIKPQPAGDLTWARGSYHSVKGLIRSEWKIIDKQFQLKVSIPPNTRSEIWIPAPDNAPITINGKPVKVSRYEKGFAVMEVGSGENEFVYRQL